MDGPVDVKAREVCRAGDGACSTLSLASAAARRVALLLQRHERQHELREPNDRQKNDGHDFCDCEKRW